MTLVLSEKYQQYLRIGTCSWKYDSWKGLHYDPNKLCHPDDYLSDDAEHLNTPEAYQWFLSLFSTGVKLPNIKMVKWYPVHEYSFLPAPPGMRKQALEFPFYFFKTMFLKRLPCAA
jgi:hypothetical protein